MAIQRLYPPSPKSLLRQTLRAALIGVILGAVLGCVASLGSWVAHQSDNPPALPGLTYIIRALDVCAFPGMTIVTAFERRGVDPNYVFSPGEVTSPVLVLALVNALFWAAVWTLLLSWPGPVFALWLWLSGSWD
jgi:hypothetical protein